MLRKLLELERLNHQVFVAHHHQENFRNTLFGGQVLAQALMAAGLTTERPVHSLHAYFLRPGGVTSPVEYEVQSIRDGKSVSTREVKAKQNGEIIFTAVCSFHEKEAGYEHQLVKPPQVPNPEQLKNNMAETDHEHLAQASKALGTAPIEFVPCRADLFSLASVADARVQFWIKSATALPNHPLMHACALAFASDIGLLATTLLPHDTHLFSGSVLPASMDHSIWFHQTCQFDQWHLYATDSPWAGGARGFSRGSIFDKQGVLVASTAQEGLIRPLSPN